MQEKIWDLLLNEQEISWRTILYDLVKSEGMSPWDVNITLITQKYIDTVRKMQEHDLKVSGKIILAAAILLKMKSTHLVDNDFSRFDALMNPEETLDELDEELYEQIEGKPRPKLDPFTLIPRNPQPRNRKVSINDLVSALQRAMATKKRVLAKMRPEKFEMPKRKIDIMEVINDIYHKITYYTEKDKSNSITFTKLLPPRAGKEEKVYTFLPLLHLENHHKVNLEQEKAFEEIHVSVPKKGKAK